MMNPQYHMVSEGTVVALNNSTMSRRLRVKQAKGQYSTLFKGLVLFMCMYVCLHGDMHILCRCPSGLEEGIRSPGVGVAGSCVSLGRARN